MNSDSYDVLVVGAGISGLCAAYAQIKKAPGKKILLLDPGTIGGLLSTKKIKGFTLEQGPNVLLEKDEIHDLILELGLRDQVVYPSVKNYRQFVWYKGKPERVPKAPSVLFKTPLLPLLDKCMFIPRLLLPGILKPQSADETVAQFLSRLTGKRAIETMVDPALKGIFGGDVSKLSARSIFPELWNHASSGRSLISFMRGRKRRKIFVLKQGMHSLCEALLNKLKPLVNIKSLALESVRKDADAGFVAQLSDGSQVHTKECIVTTSGASSAQFLSALDNDLAQALKPLPYAGLIVVHFSIAATSAPAVLKDSFGVLFPNGFTSRLLGVMFNSVLFPHLAPHDKHLLTVCLGGIDAKDVFALSDQEIIDRVHNDLNTTLNITGAEFLAIKRWDKAIPQFEVGHYRLLEKIADSERANPGLKLAGVDCAAAGVPDRVKAGLAV